MSTADILAAVALLQQGGVVAFPTDTVYGLGCHAFLEDAVRRVYRVKGRSLTQGLPLLLAETEDVRSVASFIPDFAWALAERFWPGALTLVLKRASAVPLLVTGGQQTVAVRVPNHSVPRSLARHLGAPIVGTSANLSGLPSPTTYTEVRRQLQSRVDMILRGRCLRRKESTIVDVSGKRPRILRHGAIPRREIEEALGLSLAWG